MAKIISDNEIDHELVQIKTLVESLKKTQTIFTNTYKTLPPKERAKILREVHSGHQKISAFLLKAKKLPMTNSGTKFAIENLNQTFQLMMVLWKKTEAQLGDQVAE